MIQIEEFEHPFSRYGLAVVLVNENIENKTVTVNNLSNQIENGLENFQFKPQKFIVGTFNYSYHSFTTLKNDPTLIGTGNQKDGNFLAPNIISGNNDPKKSATSVKSSFNKIVEIKTKLDNSVDLNSLEEIKVSFSPMSNEFCGGRPRRASPKTTLFEASCCAIACTTPDKPCLVIDLLPTTIIPDLPLYELTKFIQVFKDMFQSSQNNILEGSFEILKKGDGKYYPPKIRKGNFPNAPNISIFGAVSLIASIGEWAKTAKNNVHVLEVLDLLENTPLYFISAKNTKIESYSNPIIELAKKNELGKIINSLKALVIFSQGKWDTTNKHSYELYYLKTLRFLQFFNKESFADWFSVRAHYPQNLKPLIQLFFTKKMEITPEVAKSAFEIGKWLNAMAYKIACLRYPTQQSDSPTEKTKNYEKIQSTKAGVLINLEQSIFKAQSGSELLCVVSLCHRETYEEVENCEDFKPFYLKAATTFDSKELNALKWLLSVASRFDERDKFVNYSKKQTTETIETNLIDLTNI